MSLLAFLKMRILIKKEDIRMGKGYYKALLAAAVLALAGCSGKEYEKIQGIEKSEENRVLEKQEDTGNCLRKGTFSRLRKGLTLRQFPM